MSITTTAVAQSILNELALLVRDSEEFLRTTSYDSRAHGQLVYFTSEDGLDAQYCALGYCGHKRGMSDSRMENWDRPYSRLFFGDLIDQLTVEEDLCVRKVTHLIFNASDSGTFQTSDIVRFRLAAFDKIDELRELFKARGVQVS